MRRLFNLPELKETRRRLRHDRSPAEHVFWRYLKNRKFMGLKFRRQHSVGRYIVDFYCPQLRLVIEIDGDSHFESHQQAYDQKRSAFFLQLGIRVTRFTNDEVRSNPELVLKKLREYITTPKPLLD